MLASIGPGASELFSWRGLLVVAVALLTVAAVIAEYRRRRRGP